MAAVVSVATTATGPRTAASPARGGSNADAIVQPIPNFYMEIAQDWPYRQQWIARAALEGLSGRINATFFDNDAGINETVGVNYADTNVIGRAEQYKQYVGTNNREVQLTLQFRAQGAPTGSGTGFTTRDWLIQEVQNPVRWLDSLRFPYITENGGSRIAHAPPPIMLYIGELIAMRCLLTDAPIQWIGPWDTETLLPFGADVSCVFTAVSTEVSNYGFSGPHRWANKSGVTAPGV
jgi:hypothetical protein